jgi:hypothetical protein
VLQRQVPPDQPHARLVHGPHEECTNQLERWSREEAAAATQRQRMTVQVCGVVHGFFVAAGAALMALGPAALLVLGPIAAAAFAVRHMFPWFN